MVAMNPEMKGTLVDTDVEVDLDNSEDMKKKMGETSTSSSSSSSSSSSGSASVSGRTVFSGSSSSSSVGNRLASSQTAASSSVPGTMPAQGQGLVSSAGMPGLGSFAEVPRLPAEPAPEETNVIHVRVKTPTGMHGKISLTIMDS